MKKKTPVDWGPNTLGALPLRCGKTSYSNIITSFALLGNQTNVAAVQKNIPVLMVLCVTMMEQHHYPRHKSFVELRNTFCRRFNLTCYSVYLNEIVTSKSHHWMEIHHLYSPSNGCNLSVITIFKPMENAFSVLLLHLNLLFNRSQFDQFFLFCFVQPQLSLVSTLL